jgi:transcriptional regulator with XRE-family HTH domain
MERMIPQYETEIARLGERIRELRKARNYTQEQLAAYTEIPRSNISKIENGLMNLEFKTIVRIAQALEVELSSLFA